MAHSRLSRCCDGLSLDLYMRDCPDGRHIDAAVRALLAAIDRPGRLKDPYVKATADGEFRQRLKAAARGALRNLDHVKSIEAHPRCELYELRWSGISVRQTREDGIKENVSVEVRMYQTEPLEYKSAVILLHAHEKEIAGAATTEEQQRHIERAAELYHEGVHRRWGVPELIT